MPEIRLVDDVRARLNRGRKPDRLFPAKKALHFRDLEHDVRKYYAARIAQANLASVAVLIKKRDLLPIYQTPTEQKRVGEVLYHTATVALIDIISRYCINERTAGEPGDGSVDLVFSSRSSLDYNQLKDAIKSVLATPDIFGYEGHSEREIIRPAQVQAIMHSKSMGLQIADAVTSSYYYAVEASADGFTEDAYVRLLMPRAYIRAGELFGCGIKARHCSADTVKQMRFEVARWMR